MIALLLFVLLGPSQMASALPRLAEKYSWRCGKTMRRDSVMNWIC